MSPGRHDCKERCRQCMSSYSSRDVLIKHRQRCENQKITAIKTSNELHLCRQMYFHKNPLNFKFHADFEVDNEIDISNLANEATNFSKQNPVQNGHYIVTERNDVLPSGFHESPLGNNNIDWLVDEVLKKGNERTFIQKTQINLLQWPKKMKKVSKIITFVVFVKQTYILGTSEITVIYPVKIKDQHMTNVIKLLSRHKVIFSIYLPQFQ